MGSYTIKTSEDKLIFLFTGEMDTFTCMENEERILSQVKEHKGKIIFDLKEVNFIASSFIRLSGSVAVIVGRNNLTISNVNNEIRKILIKLGMSNTFNID